jgi:cell division protein ZapA
MEAPDHRKQSVRLTIFNQAYTISTAGDPHDAEELGQQVDELMSSIARRAGNLDSTRTAVLACLHLADRLRAAEQELDALRESVEHKSRNLVLMLEQAFPPD